MNNLKLAILLFFVSSQAYSEEIFFGYGLGIFNSAKNIPAEVKTINLGYRVELYSGIYWQFKGGYWKDASDDYNRKSSLYLSTGPTMLVDLKPIEVRTGLGLATISVPDSYLGDIFPQFNEELYLGVRDKNGNGIGIKYEHISSAGIVQPNIGRDFVILEISSKW